jgi:N4-gp56 family major capsid protein
MADTNFGALLTEQKTVWARDVWKEAREASFLMKFAGKGENSMVDRVTELTKSERGDRAVLTLVNDPTGDGVAGDAMLEGAEEALTARDCVITIDQLRHAHKSEGTMAEQKTIVKFRGQAKRSLGGWLGDRMDQMAFLTLAGWNYALTNDGRDRSVVTGGTGLESLAFNSDISAPTSNRHFNFTVNGLDAGDTTADDHIKFGYDALLEVRAKARTQKIKPIRGKNGAAFYHVFVHPNVMRDLKMDTEFRANARSAMQRSDSNILFAGAESFMLDGMMVHDYLHVPTTFGAAGGLKWGSAGTTNGSTVLVCGAQALGMADLGPGDWNEKSFNYGAQPGVAYGKIFGLKKPVFHSTISGQDEDFGVLRVDVLANA